MKQSESEGTRKRYDVTPDRGKYECIIKVIILDGMEMIRRESSKGVSTHTT